MMDHFLRGFDECATVLTKPEVFAVEHTNYPGAEEIRGRRGVQLLDGSAHLALHTFLTTYFSRNRDVLRLEAIKPRVLEAVEGLARKEHIEVLADLAAPLSMRVIATVLGLPHTNSNLLDSFAAWRDAIPDWVATRGEVREPRDRAIAAAKRLRELTLPVVRARRNANTNDLITALWRAGPTVFDDWGEEDVLDQCRIMMLAGSDGVARLITSCAHVVLNHQELRRRILDHGTAAAGDVVEHVCRLHPPAQLRPRIARSATDIHGCHVEPGDRVCLDVVAANRDPSHFPSSPAPFSEVNASMQHLAFNLGTRYCSGAPLARDEASETLTAFFYAYPGCTSMAGVPAPSFSGFLFLGFSPVYVQLR